MLYMCAQLTPRILLTLIDCYSQRLDCSVRASVGITRKEPFHDNEDIHEFDGPALYNGADIYFDGQSIGICQDFWLSVGCSELLFLSLTNG